MSPVTFLSAITVTAAVKSNKPDSHTSLAY